MTAFRKSARTARTTFLNPYGLLDLSGRYASTSIRHFKVFIDSFDFEVKHFLKCKSWKVSNSEISL